MQIQSTLRFHLTLHRRTKLKKKKTQVTAYSGKDMKQGNQSFIVGGNTHWYDHSKSTWWFIRKLEIVLSENSVIPLHNITRTRVSLSSLGTSS